MATKTYYNPQNGQHYYSGSKKGAFYWDAPESQKDESYINQYNYTPSYNAYRQYLEELRRQQEEEERRRQETLSPRIQVQDGQNPGAFDTQAARAKAEDRVRFEQAYNNYNAEMEKVDPNYAGLSANEKYNMFAKQVEQDQIDASRSQGMRDWAKGLEGDPDFDRMSEEEKRRQYLHNLDRVAQENGTLPEDQRAELSEYLYSGLSDKEKQAVDAIMDAENKRYENYDKFERSGSSGIFHGLLTGEYNTDYEDEEKAAIEELRKQGWDEDTIEKEVARYKELADYRMTQAKNAEMAIDSNASAGEKALKSTFNTAYGIYNAPTRGLESALSYLDDSAYGKNTSSKYALSSNRSEEGYRQVRENAIGNEHPIGQVAYDIGVSTAESLYTMLLTNAAAGLVGVAGAGTALKSAQKAGKAVTTGMKVAAGAEKALEVATLVPFSANAYDSAYREAVNRGFSEGQAQGYGIAVGGIEALTEMFSLDKAWKLAEGTKIGRNLFASAAIQAGIEGSEEVASEFGQRFADYVAVKVGKTGKTQEQLDLEEFMSQGMSREEATREVAKKFAKDVGMAALSGTISGGFTTAGAAAVGAYRSKYGNNLTEAIADKYKNLEVKGDTKYEQQLRADKERYENNPTQYIVDQFKVNNEEDAKTKQVLQEIADKEKAGKTLSVSDKSFITENVIANKDQFDNEYIADLFDLGEDRVVPYEYRDVKKNVSEDEARSALAQAAKDGDADAFIDAMNLTRNSTNKAVAEKAEEIISDYAGMAQSHGITQETIGNAVLSMKRAYIAGLNGEQLDKEAMPDKVRMAYNDGMKDALQQKSRTIVENTDALKTDITTKEGNTVTLDGEFTPEGIMTDGGVVSIDNLELDESKAVDKAYHYADKYESVNVKNNFLNNIKDGQNIEIYKSEYGKVYDSALAGLSLDNVKKQAYVELENDQIENIYDTAVVERQARAADTLREALNGVKGVGKGKAYNESSSTDPKMLKIASMLARGSKWDIHIVDEVPQNKNAQGAFVKKENAIYVRADDFMRSLGHEISHYVESYNKGEYDAVRNAVANYVSNKIGSDAFMGALKDYGLMYEGGADQDLSADDLSGEMFNDIVPMILESKQGSKAFAKYLAENYGAEEAMSFGEKIKDVIDNLAGTIRNYLSNADHNTAYAKEMKKYADDLGQFADQFIKALDGAIQNYNKLAAENVEQSGNAKEQIQFSLDMSKVPRQDQPTKSEWASFYSSVANYNEGNGNNSYVKTRDGSVIIPLSKGKIDEVDDKVVVTDAKKSNPKVKGLIALHVNNGNDAACLIANIERDIKDGRTVEDAVETCKLFAGEEFLEYYNIQSSKRKNEKYDATAKRGNISYHFEDDTELQNGEGSNSNIGKTRYSLSEDSTGRKLSKGQQEYFKNSAIRDKDGSLLQMHHGTASYGFDVFDIKKAKAANLYGRGFYFSKDSSHAGQYGQQYDVYLNIVNPLQPGKKSITKNQLLKFINAVANNEDYGIENYGQGATPQSVLDSVWGKDDFSMLQDINATCIGDFAGAVKEFNRINNTSYDGINTPTETVAFYPNQIKDINNKKPTNADSMRFSLSEEDAKDIKKKAKKSKAVDVTKDLVAVHNLGEQQLIESLKLQGLPSPSIAIIRSGMMHDKYGAISLIFKSDTIDPKNSTRNKVYGGDGWTPTFPAIEVKINRSVAEKIWDKIDSLVSAAEQRSIGYANVDTDNLQDKANRNRGDVVDAYRDNKALQYAFLKDNGIDIDVPSEDVRLDEHWTNEQILAVLDIIKDRKQAESLREGYRAYESNPELVEELRQALNQQFRQKYVDKGNAKLFDKDLYEELSFNDFDHLTKGVFKYYREGIQQQMDSQAARAAIQEQIKEHEAEYDKWLRNLFDGIIEKRGLRNNKDVFLPSGNRRSWEALHDDYTLENIVKIMNQQEERGEAAFFSQSAIQALSTKNFKSLDEIRKSKGQLRVETEEEHEKRITEQSEKFTEICNEIMDKSESNSFIAFGRASDAIAEAIRRYRTVQGIDRELRQWRGLNIKSDTAQKIVDLMNEIAENPTGYFEAKPKRAVWLDEIKKAIIPNNVSEDTIKALDDAGIPYEMYRYEDEGQRRDIIAAMEDVKFSLSEDSEGRELSDDQVKYFKNSKAVDAEGRLLELYHGTEAQAFSVFSTPGIWVTPDKELATEYAGEWNNWRNERDDYGHINYETNGMEPEVYGDKYLRMYKVYANVTNPVFLGELNRTLPDDYAGMEFDTLGIKTEEQFDKLYDLVQQHIGDKVWQLTETKEFIDLMKELGYDGMFASENGHRTICVFDSNQLKKVDNLTPTEDKDIRYSITENSKGEDLTEGQQRYFNRSQNLDDEHRLMVMYHGTEAGGFTVFDPTKSDDEISLFFTDNEAVAKSYIFNGSRDRIDAHLGRKALDYSIADAEGIKAILEERGYTNVSFHEKVYDDGAKFRYWDFTTPEGNEVKRFQNKDTIALASSEKRGEKSGVYAVYLNIEKPLKVDAQNRHFDDIRFETEEGQLNSTREIAEYAKEHGYDGVIFKNLRDNGGGFAYDVENSRKAGKPSTVAIVFSPDQVKSINNLNPTSSKDIRYALVDDDWVNFDEILGSQTPKDDARTIDILKRGMEAMKNQEVDMAQVKRIATKLRNEYGSSYNINRLTADLIKAFAYMQSEDHVDYPTMMGILKDIARPVVEESGEKVGEQEYKDFLEYFKGKKIKLTSTQKQEVRERYGSYKEFRNAMMPITISDNADSTLDQLWDEMVKETGYVLDIDANEGDMPVNLLDTLQAMRPTVRNDFNGDIEDVAKDLAMRIVEEYIEGEAQKEMSKEIKEIRNRIKKGYQERYKNYRGKANAEILARNKRRGEEAKERQQVRDLKHDIKINANKLLRWVEKPTEGKSVPHDMMVPVLQFLNAIDFVDPVITVDENGKFHTRVFDRVDYEDGHKKFIYHTLTGDTREDVFKQFNEAIGRGEGTKEQRSWTEKMQGMREIYDKVLASENFEDTSMDFLMQTLDGEGLTKQFDDLLTRHAGQVSMNQLDSKDLKLIDNIVKNIFHALNQANKAYSQPSTDIVNLAQSTIQDAEGKKLKARSKTGQAVYNFFRINNATPKVFFEVLGRNGNKVYKFLRNALNREILDVKQVSEFMNGVMKGVDASKWTGRNATVHTIPVSHGQIQMTDDQIMSLYETIRRTGGMDRIKGGIEIERLDVKGNRIEQEAIHLTDADIKKIESVLTPEMIEVADKIQKYMANDMSKMGNETSRQLYGYEKFTDPTYYPWRPSRDTIATSNSSENIPMFTSIERSGFTKQLKEGANNPLVIRGIFDVFADHVAEMAAYHGYAAAVKDTLRWLNYREKSESDGFVQWSTTKNAINKIVNSKDGVKYITDLLLDINHARKSDYLGAITEVIMGSYKAAAVGANARVVVQQPTAYFRALDMIDAKYLMMVNPKTAIKNIKKSQEQCPISWWKSQGYYETNLGKPVKELVTGIETKTEKVKDVLMKPAGLADDFTWGFLYTAVEKEQRDKLKGKNLSEEEFRKAVNERFDDVVDTTQVVDSVLHRSAFMRSKDKLNIIQTAFMAEPTKTYNMVMEAIIKDMNEGKIGKRTSRAAAAFLITALVNAAAQSLVDVPRHAGDDDDYWEKFKQYMLSNFEDNVNPFNLLPVLKDVAPDIFKLFTGEVSWNKGSGSRFDTEAVYSLIDMVSAWKKHVSGEGNKTGFGVVMATLKPLSQFTGIPMYNLTRDAVALYNAFFDNIETTVTAGSTAKNEKKKEFVKNVNKEKSEDVLDEGITEALESGISIYDLKSAVQSEYKNKYFDAYSDGDTETANEYANKAARAYARMGLSDEEIDEIINDWKDEIITYSALDKAIASGEGIEEAVKHVQQAKDNDKIVKHIMDRFSETVAYEDTHETESDWRGNVDKALAAVDPTLDFDSANEEAMQKAAEKAAEDAQEAKVKGLKNDFFEAVDSKNGSAGRKALEGLKAEGKDAKSIKSSVSTKYHEDWKNAKTPAEKAKAKSDWKSAYTLINNFFGVDSKDLDKTWNDWESKQ